MDKKFFKIVVYIKPDNKDMHYVVEQWLLTPEGRLILDPEIDRSQVVFNVDTWTMYEADEFVPA